MLIRDPVAGDVMKGCGGLRKIRVADRRRGKGKRGGARVIYLHVPAADWVLLLDIYGKDDLSAEERKVLKQLAEDFKAEAARAAARGKGETNE